MVVSGNGHVACSPGLCARLQGRRGPDYMSASPWFHPAVALESTHLGLRPTHTVGRSHLTRTCATASMQASTCLRSFTRRTDGCQDKRQKGKRKEEQTQDR